MTTDTKAFLTAMHDDLGWVQVFGPDRPLEAGRLAAALRALRPTEGERVAGGFGEPRAERHVRAYDRGVRWFADAYYDRSSLLEV